MNCKFQRLSAAVIILLLFSGAAFAKKAVWVEGQVTKVPHEINERYYIQVDGDLYRVLPDIPVAERQERSPGSFDEKKVSLSYITEGQDIFMKVRNNQVIQIILY